MIDGQLRIAKTGDWVGSPIFLNLDLMYLKGANGQVQPLSFPDAVAILVHEMGHHHGVKDHQALDVLGAKVESLLHGHIQEVDLGRGIGRKITATSIDFDSDKSYTQVLVTDGLQILDFSDVVKQKLLCPDTKQPPAGVEITNLHWVDPIFEFLFNNGAIGGGGLPWIDGLEARAKLSCGEGQVYSTLKIRTEFLISVNSSPTWRSKHPRGPSPVCNLIVNLQQTPSADDVMQTNFSPTPN